MQMFPAEILWNASLPAAVKVSMWPAGAAEDHALASARLTLERLSRTATPDWLVQAGKARPSPPNGDFEK